jgi:hypothetical protein
LNIIDVQTVDAAIVNDITEDWGARWADHLSLTLYSLFPVITIYVSFVKSIFSPIELLTTLPIFVHKFKVIGIWISLRIGSKDNTSMINNLHILEECGVSTNRYFGGVWGVNKQIFKRC